jgi:hypothetical protein
MTQGIPREPWITDWDEGDAWQTLPDPVFHAGYKHVDLMMPTKDTNAPFPAWYGWALRYSFWSGWHYANAAPAEHPRDEAQIAEAPVRIAKWPPWDKDRDNPLPGAKDAAAQPAPLPGPLRERAPPLPDSMFIANTSEQQFDAAVDVMLSQRDKDDDRDAKRYRWLREWWGARPTKGYDAMFAAKTPKQLDAAIDAQMSRKGSP